MAGGGRRPTSHATTPVPSRDPTDSALRPATTSRTKYARLVSAQPLSLLPEAVA